MSTVFVFLISNGVFQVNIDDDHVKEDGVGMSLGCLDDWNDL